MLLKKLHLLPNCNAEQRYRTISVMCAENGTLRAAASKLPNLFGKGDIAGVLCYHTERHEITMKARNSMSDTTSPKITVYSTSWCSFCHTEMEWLDSLGIPYTKKDIEADEGARDELMQRIDGNFQGVPVTFIGDDMVLGFNRPVLLNLLDKGGYIKG